MSKNPMMQALRSSAKKDGQVKPASVSSIEAPLAVRERFRRAEDLDETLPSRPAEAVTLPTASILGALPDDTEWSQEYRHWCSVNRYQPGATIEVSLSQVKESSFNPRHFYLARRLEDLVASIAEGGQQQPIHVVPDYENPGEFFLHDGGRRVRAMRSLKLAKALALVVDIPPGIQGYKLGYELNTRREGQSPFDNAVKWKFLLDNKHFASQKELAETLGQDESIVSQTLTIGSLPEEVMLDMINAQERFPVRVAYEVSKFHENNEQNLETTRDLVERIIRLGMSQRQVIEFRSKFNARRREGGSSTSPRTSRQRSGSAVADTDHNGVQGRGVGTGLLPAAGGEQYRSDDGTLHAVLTEQGDAIRLDITGTDKEALAGVLQSIRHLLASVVR